MKKNVVILFLTALSIELCCAHEELPFSLPDGSGIIEPKDLAKNTDTTQDQDNPHSSLKEKEQSNSTDPVSAKDKKDNVDTASMPLNANEPSYGTNGISSTLENVPAAAQNAQNIPPSNFAPPQAGQMIFVDSNFNRINENELKQIVLHDSRQELAANSREINVTTEKKEVKKNQQKTNEESKPQHKSQLEQMYSLKGFTRNAGTSGTQVISSKDFEKFGHKD